MTPYTVVFNMPAFVAEGIKNGTMEVIGGVVRMADGKQVVMWLRPMLDEGTKVLPAASRLPLLAGGAALTAAAVSVAVVTVVAFVLLSKQVSRVERRLDAALLKLKEIKADTDWLKRFELAKQKAKFGAALLAAETMEANGDFDGLTGPLQTFEAVRAVYADLMRQMIEQGQGLEAAPAFVEFSQLYVAATAAKARALTLLRGEEHAAQHMRRDADEFRELRRSFLLPLDSPDRALEQLARLDDASEAALAEWLPTLPPAAAADYLLVPGLGRDPATLRAMLDASTPKPGEPAGAVVVTAFAPVGWLPEQAS